MYENLVQELKQFQEDAFVINEVHGFNETDHQIGQLEAFIKSECRDEFLPLVQMFRNARNGLRLMLIVSELVEALNAMRTGNGPDDHLPRFSGFSVECADALIRILNMCRSENQPVVEAMVAKSQYNSTREFKHGGKAF